MARTARKEGAQRSVLKRGNAAMDTLKQEQERAEARREAAGKGVFRFYISKDERGRHKEHEVVVLDDDATACPFAHEHLIPGPRNDFSKAQNHICVDEVDDCSLCRAREMNLGDEFGHPTYGQYITVLDLTPYVIKRGPRAGATVESSRKMMVIPYQSVTDFHKIFELAKKNHGTTRGLTMVLTKSKDTDPRCGRPQMLDNGMLFDMMTEDELDEYANEEVVRDGKVIKEEGEDLDPIDYEEELAPPDQKILRKFYNIPAPAGSEDEEEAETGRNRRQRRRAGRAAEDQAEDTTRDDGPPARTRRRARAQEDEDEPEPTTTSRRRRTSAAAPEPEDDTPPPSARRRRLSREEVDDEIPF